MPEGDKPKADEPRGTQATPEPKGEERRYTREELRERARSLLDVSPHVLAAALAEEDAKTFTLDKAKSLVEKAQKRPERVDSEHHEAAA